MTQNTPLNYGDPAKEPFFDAIQELLSSAAPEFRIVRVNATTIGVNADADNGQKSIAVQGRYRKVTANITRSMPGGSAGTYVAWVTAADNAYTGSGANLDQTDYSYALAVTDGTAPTGVALRRPVANILWDGNAIVAIDMLVGPASGVLRHAASHAAGAADAITPGAIGAATAQALADAVASLNQAIGNEATARQTGDQYNPTASQKAALAGTSGGPSDTNRYLTDGDARNTNQRVPTDASVTGAKVADFAVSSSKTYLNIPLSGSFLRLPKEVHGGQPGIYTATGLAVTAASGMAVATNAGKATVADDEDLLTVRLGALPSVAIAAANASNPRLDQVYMVLDPSQPTNGASIVVQTGTPTNNATLDNRSGANATVPARSIRLADVLVPAGSSSVAAANIRDRRPWARGLSASVATAGGGSTTGLATIPGAVFRGEFSGGPIRLEITSNALSSTGANQEASMVVTMDGSNVLATGNVSMPRANVGYSGVGAITYQSVTAGSKLLLGYIQSALGGAVSAQGVVMSVREILTLGSNGTS